MDREKDDVALDALFGASRARPPEPSRAFLAQLRADADAVHAMPAQVRQGTQRSLISRFAGVFAASGLSGAAALGVWIGFAMPDMLNLDTFTSTSEDVGLYAFLPGADLTALGE